MRTLSRKGFLLLGLLLMTAVACRFTVELPWNVDAPDVEISPQDVAAAATRAAEAAATAASLADQAGQLAATAVLEGDNILSTAVAGEGLPGVGAGAAVAGSLQQKLASITPDGNGNFNLTITDADMAEYIALQGGGVTYNDITIENIRVNILPQHVVVAGQVTDPVSLPMTANFRPVVSDGRLRFAIIDATAGIFPVPSSMVSLLETGVNFGLGQAFDTLPAGVSMQDVALGNGSMTIIGGVN
jgi:hypothetical protein